MAWPACLTPPGRLGCWPVEGLVAGVKDGGRARVNADEQLAGGRAGWFFLTVP